MTSEILMNAIEVDIERCKGCQYCIEACPEKIIILSKSLNSKGYHYACLIDQDKCTRCTYCALICPDVAIEVYK